MARVGIARNDAAAAGEVVEILEDHARVEQRAAVVEDECGDFSERVLLAQIVCVAGGVGRHDFDAAAGIRAESSPE